MIRRQLLGLLTGTVLLSLLQTGCKPEGPRFTTVEDVRKICLLSSGINRAYTQGQVTLLQQLAAQNPAWEVQVLNAAGDASLQEEQLAKTMANPPYALLIDPVDGRSQTLKQAVQEAAGKGVLTFGLGLKAEPLAAGTLLTVDHRKLGQLAGELSLKALRAKAAEKSQPEVRARIVEIRGEDYQAEGDLRHEGFATAIKAEPGLIIVHDAPGNWTQDGGRDRLADALRLQHSFDLVYAHDDVMALGAARALKEQRSEVMVIGTDGFRGSLGGLTLVGEGEIDATIYQPLLVDFAWLLIRKTAAEPGFRPKGQYELESRIITPKDLADIARQGLAPFPEP